MLHLFDNDLCSYRYKRTFLGQNKTNIQANKTNNEDISDQTTFLKNKVNPEVDEENHELRNIYWTPKL